MFKEKDFLKNVFFSRFFIIALIVLIFFAIISTGRTIWRKFQIDREISALKNSILEIEGKNKELLARLDYFKDEENLEQEARSQLNVKRPGEKVIVILNKEKENRDYGSDKKNDFGKNSSADKNDKGRLSNPLRWWNYFFGGKE